MIKICREFICRARISILTVFTRIVKMEYVRGLVGGCYISLHILQELES